MSRETFRREAFQPRTDRWQPEASATTARPFEGAADLLDRIDARARRWASIGAIAGCLVVTAIATVVGWAMGLGIALAVALGGFAGIWGGTPIGLRLGARMSRAHGGADGVR